MAKKGKAEVAEVEDDDVELEELDEAAEEDGAKAKKKRADAPAFGIQELCAHLTAKTGKEYKPREVRILLRKMARDGSGRIEREITPDNRSRYSWEGPKDPQVKLIVAAVTAGEIEEGKKAALDKLKQDKAAKDALAGKTKKAKAEEAPAKAKKAKAPAPPVDDDDDDLEIDDDDE